MDVLPVVEHEKVSDSHPFQRTTKVKIINKKQMDGQATDEPKLVTHNTKIARLISDRYLLHCGQGNPLIQQLEMELIFKVKIFHKRE